MKKNYPKKVAVKIDIIVAAILIKSESAVFSFFII